MAAWDRVRIDGGVVEYVLDNGTDPANVYWLEIDGSVYLVAHEDPRDGGHREYDCQVVRMDTATTSNIHTRVAELLQRSSAVLRAAGVTV